MATARQMHSASHARADRAVRSVCAVGAIAVTGVLAAGLLGLFYQASPPRWLAPTPQLIELAEACQDLPGRADRLHCTRAVVASHRDRIGRDGDTVLADRR